MSKRVLVTGGGGREHALLWKLAQSPRIGKLYAAPGNGGTCQIAENVSLAIDDIEGQLRFAERNNIDLTIVGPDNPLALGVVDIFRASGLRIFGPTQAAAEIESSKAFAKELMRDARIPMAAFRIFREYNNACAYVQKRGAPIVIKAGGLARGKGVYPSRSLQEAEDALAKIMLERVHGDAGDKVIVEEFLQGQEISLHALCDGKNSVLFPPSQDHKAIFDGDEGSNTGGMGVITPISWVDADTLQALDELVVKKTLAELSRCGRPFSGLLYPGIMMTQKGPKVLEFNARFGDPEAQVYVRLLKSDLLDILEACIDGTLAEHPIEWHPGFAVCIVIASGGYPDVYQKGLPIHGVSEAEHVPGVIVFHAGTTRADQLRTSGGRVLGVSAVASTLQEALVRAYEAVQCISFEGMHYRHDIGAKASAMEL